MRFVKVFVVDMNYPDADADRYAVIVDTLWDRLSRDRHLLPNLRSLRFDARRSILHMRYQLIFTRLFNLLLSPRMTSKTLGELIMTRSTLDFFVDYCRRPGS